MATIYTTPVDYWIAPNAITISLNALGDANRIYGSVTSGAVIMCYVDAIKPASQGEQYAGNGDGLNYGADHEPRRWPLSISNTYFNDNTPKYVYVAIPRSAAVGTKAVVVFPGEKLDIYGRAERRISPGSEEVVYEQVGSEDYFYVWLQGIIGAPADSPLQRAWTKVYATGELGTAEGNENKVLSTDWYQYNTETGIVSFLKQIVMAPLSWFQTLRLGNDANELTDVAKATTPDDYIDSEKLVVTPSYLHANYLSKKHDDVANGNITFKKNVSVEGNLGVIGYIKSKLGYFASLQSENYTGDGMADTGYRLTSEHNGHSKLTIDEIYVRMKAVFESLEVRERIYTGGDQIWSCAGNQIVRTEYMGNLEDAQGQPAMSRVHADGTPDDGSTEPVYEVPTPGDTYGYSTIKVPWILRNIPILANFKAFAKYRTVRITLQEPDEEQPAASRSLGDDEEVAPITKIRRARCYFLANDGDRQIHNWWRINDLARCQTMNLSNITRKTYLVGENSKVGNIFWWRKVIGVSYEPVTLDDGRQYHYFDVSFNYEVEKSHSEQMATSVMPNSDIPAAGDSVVQFGNTIIEGRMNLMMMEVAGSQSVSYDPSSDAPCLKAYRGIYSFDLTKCWVGGHTCKMKLSPKTGYEFYGPNFKQVTEYDVVPVPVERGLWTNICRKKNAAGRYIDEWEFEQDDYGRTVTYSDDAVTGRTSGVRKCYYYDKVSHNGSYWLCSIVDGAHWVAGVAFVDDGTSYAAGQYLSDAAYAALTDENKPKCIRRANYTIEEPSENSIDWTKVVDKGEDGGTPEIRYQWNQSATNHPDLDASNPSATSPDANWKIYVPNRPDNGWFLWCVSAIKRADGTYGTWGNFVRLTGDTGTPGEDGDEVEWIYSYQNTGYDGNSGTVPDTDPQSPTYGQRIPSSNKNQDDWVPDNWRDNPAGIDQRNVIEYASWRQISNNGTTKVYAAFQQPIIWSHWGRNGMDGDGVEYVFIRTKQNIPPTIYDDEHYTDSNTHDYTVDEHLPRVAARDDVEKDNSDPGNTSPAKPYECTDDQKGVDSVWRYEWAAKRTMGSADPATGERQWRWYVGAMKLWNNFAESAVRLDIDNEMDMVQTNSEGLIMAARTVSTIVHLYDGAGEADISAVTITVSGGPASSIATFSQSAEPDNGKGRELSWAFIAGQTMADAYDVDISYVYQNQTYRATFTISASKGMAILQLKPSYSALPCTLNPNNTLNNPPALSLKILKIDGNSTTDVDAIAANLTALGVTVRYSVDGTMPASASAGSDWSALSPANNLQATSANTNIYMAMFNAAGNLLDRETVPLVKDGENGAPGPDGLTIRTEPNPVILTQSASTESSFDLPKDVKYKVLEGDVPCTVTSVTTANAHGVTVTPKTGTTDTVQITAVVPTSGEYPQNADFETVISITRSDNTTAQITVRTDVYINLLGKFSRFINDGVEVALGVAHVYDITTDPVTGERVVDRQYLYKEVNSAQESITTLSEKVNDGKNLLMGSLTGEEWLDAWFEHGDVEAEINSDGGIYYSQLDVLQSPSFITITGNSYTLSFYAPALSASQQKATLVNMNLGTYTEIELTQTSERLGSLYRYKATFEAEDTEMSVAFAFATSSYPVYRSMVETGAQMTAFVAGDMEMSSSIKQTASEIDLNVRTDLGQAGININGNNREIKLLASKVNFYNSAGTALNPLIYIEPSTGKFHAVDGDFEGIVRASTLYQSMANVELGILSIQSDVVSAGELINSQACNGKLPNILVLRCISTYSTTAHGQITVNLPPAGDYQGHRMEVYVQKRLKLTDGSTTRYYPNISLHSSAGYDYNSGDEGFQDILFSQNSGSSSDWIYLISNSSVAVDYYAFPDSKVFRTVLVSAQDPSTDNWHWVVLETANCKPNITPY